MSTTAARPTSEYGSHFYTRDGEPLYEVMKKDGSGMRPFTLADARKMTPSPLPSVTTILGVLHKEALVQWKIEQAVLACLTSPKRSDEALDQFVQRILHTERVQDQESDIAKARGTEIHAALEGYFAHGRPDDAIMPWIEPVIKDLEARNLSPTDTEHILVGNGYAGKCDLIAFDFEERQEWIIDFKTTKNLPKKESYWEHKMQTAAYLRCRLNGRRHANIYISTVNKGEFVFHDNGGYIQPFSAFESLLQYWRFANCYAP